MILVWWERMAETGWYTNTFKSLARQLLCRDRSVQLCAEADTADMFGVTPVQSHKSLLPAKSLLPSSVENPLEFCPRHQDKCLAAAQYYDVRNISKELRDDALRSLGKPRKITGPLDTNSKTRGTKIKKVLVEGKSWAHTATCVQTLHHTYQHMPKEQRLLLAPKDKGDETKCCPFKVINTRNYNNALNYCLNSCCT